MRFQICTICCDEDEEIKFECKGPECDYSLCQGCVEDAFRGGQHCRKCPMCNHPTARDMLIAQVGKGGLTAVEQEIRPQVEHQVRQELSQREESREKASELNAVATVHYNKLVEKLNLKCPRCQMAFHDYEGCNALKCANQDCRAQFCAICLKDCGADAHPHVRAEHGNLFNKSLFYESKKSRTREIVNGYLKRLEEQESFELAQSVKNQLALGGHLVDTTENPGHDNSFVVQTFVNDAKKDLHAMVNGDRIGVLKDDDSSWERIGLRRNHISPRSLIPEYASLSLGFSGSSEDGAVFAIRLEVQVAGHWRVVDPDTLKEMMQKGVVPAAGMLQNVIQSLRCAVLAIEGHWCLVQCKGGKVLGPSKICLRFTAIGRDGSLGGEQNPREFDNANILAINANQRLTGLQAHAERSDSQSLPRAVKHLVGSAIPTPVFRGLRAMLGDSLGRLNDNQEKAAHPLLLKTATEVAGPPGTGKTQVIGSLVLALLTCSDKNIVVLSERNGAIDAIAEKFLKLCLDKRGQVMHLGMWKNILAFGSQEAIGVHTKQFLAEEKLNKHPDVVEAKRVTGGYLNAVNRRMSDMKSKLGSMIRSFGDFFDDDDAYDQHRNIAKSCTTPTTLINAISKANESLEELKRDITEFATNEVVKDNPDLLEKLFAIPRDTKTKFGAVEEPDWNKKGVLGRVKWLIREFRAVLEETSFGFEAAAEVEKLWKAAQQNQKAISTRVQLELTKFARLKMSTIGSSHRLFADETDNQGDDDLVDVFNAIDIDDGVADGLDEGTVVIFDESGCIPSYELLGLNRLECEIDAVFVVGDKHQLPPYDPASNNRGKRGASQQQRRKLKSLLDVSRVPNTIRLDVQYRVPRDIAEILNSRVYSGNYQSADGVPRQGLHFVNVPWEGSNTKYENHGEIQAVFDLVREKTRESRRGSPNILILTPYKKQQIRLQFEFKKRPELKISADRILTVDQCQGQEADIVIFTLVQRPTRFLNKNRLNVALSRTKKELYIVADRDDFSRAARSDWECSYIAQDLLVAS